MSVNLHKHPATAPRTPPRPRTRQSPPRRLRHPQHPPPCPHLCPRLGLYTPCPARMPG